MALAGWLLCEYCRTDVQVQLRRQPHWCFFLHTIGAGGGLGAGRIQRFLVQRVLGLQDSGRLGGDAVRRSR